MPGRNQEIIDLFAELVRLTTLDEGGPASFRVRAYENALRELEEYRGELDELSESQLTKIDGVGKSTAKKIREYFDKGRIAKLEKLRAKYPPEFVELTRVPGLGPKSVLALRDRLGVSNIDQLRAAIESKKIRELEGFGAKSEENISRALERMGGLGKNKRRSIAEALPLALLLTRRLESLDVVEQATFCGSLRRFRETIGDIDIVAVAADHSAVMDAFTNFDEVEEIVGRGETKSSVIMTGGLQVDLRVVDGEQIGAATLYFTGSKAHNIKLRQRAIARAWTLNEYGLTEADGGAIVASSSEEEIYKALELDFVPPPMREDHGEVEAAASGTLPAGPAGSDFHGDWSVGHDVAKEAVRSARAAGLSYLVVSAPAEELSAARAEWKRNPKGVHLYWAAEVSPGQELPEQVEADFAVVRIPEKSTGDITDSVLSSLSNPRVRGVLGASGRIVAEHDGAVIDVTRVAEALVDCNGLWLVRSALEYLDPGADLLRRARDSGVRFALCSESAVQPLASIAYGPQHCLRGWVDASMVVNRWERAAVDAWLAAS